MTPTVAIIEIVSTTKTSTDLLFTIFLLIGSLTWRVVIEWFVVGPADQKMRTSILTRYQRLKVCTARDKNRIGGESVIFCNKNCADVLVELAGSRLMRLVRLALFANAGTVLGAAIRVNSF